MTLLSMCQHVARRTGYPVPNTIIGNADRTAARLLAAAQEEGEELSKGIIIDNQEREVGRHNWQILIREGTFNTSNGTSSYAMSTVASDFDRFINDSWWNRSSDTMLEFVSAERWQQIKGSATSGTGIRQRVRLRGGNIIIDPTPTSTESIYFEYITTKWCQSSGATAQTAWAADTDTGLLSETLMRLGIQWRFKQIMGEAYADDLNTYLKQVRFAMMADGGRTAINMPYELTNVPENGYGA